MMMTENMLFFCRCQPATLTRVLEHINHFFAALFGVEMLLKVVGHGFYGYIQDGFNVFDGFIVLLRYQTDIGTFKRCLKTVIFQQAHQ